MENSENQKRCGWSIERNAQTVGVTVAVLLTISAFITNTGSGSRDPFGGTWILLAVALWPTEQIYNAFGYTLILWENNQWRVFSLCLVFFINSVLLFLAGTIVGCLIQRLKKKK